MTNHPYPLLRKEGSEITTLKDVQMRLVYWFYLKYHFKYWMNQISLQM